MIFAEVPDDYSSWYYLQLSRSQVAFYQGMRLMKTVTSRGIGSLGSAILYENHFVCIEQGDEDLNIVYGKSPPSKELGEVKTSFTFRDTGKSRVSFYTFGTGQSSLRIDDLRVIDGFPKNIKCPLSGYKKVGRKCVMICHEQCQGGCDSPSDAKSCKSCKNMQYRHYTGRVICSAQCPAGMEPKPGSKTCTNCKVGNYKAKSGNTLCDFCPSGKFQDQTGMSSCKECGEGTFSNKDTTKCTKCDIGYFNDKKGQPKCKKCPVGSSSTKKGSVSCTNCPPGKYFSSGERLS